MFKINSDEIKIIITDIDGTLYPMDHKALWRVNNQQNIDWVKKAIQNNIYFVMNTGNLPFFLKDMLIDISGEINDYNKYFISCTGNLIYNFKTNESIVENYFDKELIMKIVDKIKKYKLVYFIASENGDVIYFSDRVFKEKLIQQDNSLNGRLHRKDLTQEILNNFKYSPRISMKNVLPQDKLEIIKIFEEEFKDEKINTTWWSDDGVDLTIGTTNKYNGIKHLLKIINSENDTNLTLNNVIYFGDNENDLSVFKNLKYCIAVNDAIPEIKELAFDISCDSKDGAIGFYLKKILV
ncbi:HAD hydrolase family protein [Mesoplasma corruscae]|uniref:HAD superfamily hydrolase n=1 Tax=Mesoplasma corruscae TaxID=216874 RepID=A0A2S5RET2_9MOLU|nr:HAD family hydrolase [Mesoplasma corruscae]PPE05645.1 hypothetical protein MCORR_v1c06720 [Mesoplasma corruscae]